MASEAEDTTSGRRRPALDLLLLVAVALLVAWVLKTFVAQAFYIPSESMENQLEPGDRVIVSKLSYHLHDPHRGDIVVFPSPEMAADGDSSPLPIELAKDLLEAVGLRQPDRQMLIKRIVGLPGEVVEGKAGHVFVDGRELIEPYLGDEVTTTDFTPVTVPDDQVWVMGDNREFSRDSRVFGPVRESTIVGRAILKVWPPTSAEFL